MYCGAYSDSKLDIVFLFLFKPKTAYEMRISDWSSDVCASDLGGMHTIGQPMWMSMIAAPLSAASLAASPMSCAVQPTSCIDTGSSSGCHAAFWIDWRVSRIAAWLATISVTLSPEPYRRTSVRNGLPDTPENGRAHV